MKTIASEGKKEMTYEEIMAILNAPEPEEEPMTEEEEKEWYAGKNDWDDDMGQRTKEEIVRQFNQKEKK